MTGRPDLRPHTEEIVRRLLGQPNERLSTRDQLRFGTNGSVAVDIGGRETGCWYDHENGVGGGLWDLLRVKGGLVDGEAFDWLRSELGIEIGSRKVKVSPRIVATYDYREERGELLFQVVRFEPKDFRQRRPDWKGGWIWSVKGTRQVPYRLPELIATPPDVVVYIPEGEKDCNRLATLGLATTCNPGGAARARNDGKLGKPKWLPEFNQFFRGHNVVVLPDNDDAGRDHARAIAANLALVAAWVRILELPGLKSKGDVSDWLDAGGTREELGRLVEKTPNFHPDESGNTSNRAQHPAEEFAPRGDFASARRQRLDIGSDVEIAERVAADFRREFGEVVFVDGDFWRYEGKHWQPIDDPNARRAVHLYDGAIYETPSHELAAVKLSKGRIDSVLHEMGAILARPNFFADAPAGINCASGFIAFDATGQPGILPHDRDHRCRHVLLGRWRSGIGAEDLLADSLLSRLLGGVFKGDQDELDKRKLLAEIAGAAALGYATKLRQPKAIVLKGEKAENGKSQILDLIRGLLPASAIATVTAAKFGDDRFIIGLRGKLLNATDELSASEAIASDTFKAVITGEPVSGRDVYRSAITFRPVAQHICATNTLPTFAGGMDRGVQRRLLVVTFNRVIPVGERIESIGLRVGTEEPDLLLAWAVAGAARLIRQKGFTVPDSSVRALRDWLFGADPVLAWTEARVRERNPACGGYKSGHAHGMFKDWALTNGFRECTVPAVNGFVQRLQANLTNVVVKHTRSGNWLRGFEILLQDQKDDEDTTG